VLRSMGLSARETVRSWGPERFGNGLMAAAEAGLARAARRGAGSRFAGRLLASALSVVAGTRPRAPMTDSTRGQEAQANAVRTLFTEASASYSGLFLAKRSGSNFEFRQRLAIAAELSAAASGSLLDCGVGPGEIAAAVLRTGRFGRAVCLDISQPMLELARRAIEPTVATHMVTELEFVRKDIFEFTAENSNRRFNLILCLGLIAHTGRLSELLGGLRRMLVADGAILLQTTLLDHPGVRIVSALTKERYYRRHGYRISYFRQRDILAVASHSGLAVVACRRFGVGFPFGDRIWAWGNYCLEKALQRFATSHGAEAIYVLKYSPGNG
jgi:ubiquinone/menaquinone biosynthesis C-methylase UbiE